MRNISQAFLVFLLSLFCATSLFAQNAYITNSSDSSVSVIDTKTNTVIATIPTPYRNPNSVVVSPDGSKVYIDYGFNAANNIISVINTSTNTIINNIVVGATGFSGRGIDISPDGSTLYYNEGSGGGDTVFVVNTSTFNIISKILVSGNTQGIAVSPDGTKVFVAELNGIYIINTATNTIKAHINLGINSLLIGIAVSPDGSKAYIADIKQHNIIVLNTATNTILTTISTGSGSGFFPYGVVVSPDGSKVYASNRDINNVAVINTATNALVDTISTGSIPWGVSLTPNGALLYVSNAGSNTVSVFNTSSNSLVSTVPVGQQPLAFGKFIGGPNVPLSNLPPIITSFTPLSGRPGSIVNITGTNFDSVASGNIVYFGAVQVTIVSGSTKKLSAIAPSGATFSPITIGNATNSLIGYSPLPFLPTYNNSAFNDSIVNFSPKVDFVSASGNIEKVVICDIDGDGKPDLVAENAPFISIYRNTSASGSITTGSFAPRVNFAAGTGARTIATGDLDGDGRPDIAIVNQGANTISIFRNTAASGSIDNTSLSAKVDFPTGLSPDGIAIADIDGDGKADIIVANFLSNTISVFKNKGIEGSITSASFAPKVDFPTGANPWSVAIGDLDGDGRPDIVVGNQSSNNISVFRNNGLIDSVSAGSLAGKVDFFAGSTPQNVSLADLDGDGKLDIAVANYNSGISVFRNTATAGSITNTSFAGKVDFIAGGRNNDVAIADINGDGKPDLVVNSQTLVDINGDGILDSSLVSVFRNTSVSGSISNSSFAAKADFVTAPGPQNVVVGDIDGDGKPDLVVSYNTNKISVLRNSPIIAVATGTKLGIKSFSIFAGDSAVSLIDSMHYGVEIASWNGSDIQGNIGSNSFVQFTNPGNTPSGSFPIFGNVYGNVVNSTGFQSINGSVYVLNKNEATYNILNFTGGGAVNNPGNIFVNGNAFVNSVVAGTVQIPPVYTFSGTEAGGGIDNTMPVFPQMPDLPPVSNYAVPTAPDITGTRTIVPGSYGNIILNGSQTLTFSGVGTYVFGAATLANANNFIFDFKNNTTGAFQVVFTKDVDLGNINATMINGGSAARIFTEAKGTGTPANNFTAFAINTRGGFFSPWYGTVYAPFGAIAGGDINPQSVTVFTGCLWSKTKVTLGVNIGLTYAPPAVISEIQPSTDIIPYYPSPANGKVNTLLGSELTSLYENPIPTDSIIYRIFGDSVVIDVIVQPNQYSQALNFLQANGLSGTIGNGEGSLIITGKFPIPNLLILNTRPDIINYARPLYFPLNNTGIIESQGDTSLQTNFVRKAYNLTGQGVKVGVLSDSYNTLPRDYAGIDIANGDLPGPGNPYNHLTPVQLLGEYPFGQSIDEGRAMLEIIHDLAPGASLAFRTGFTTPGDFALGISELQAAGCNVLVDDITFITEPFFKDGVVAHAVDNAVAAGATYFSAAGNFGVKSYEGTFSGVTAPASLVGVRGSVHDFGGGNPLQTLNLQPGNYTIVLQWDDNIYSTGNHSSGAGTDLDIYLVDNFGSILFGFNRNNLNGDPLEVLPFTVMKRTTANLLIAKAAGPDVHFKYIVFRGNLTIQGYAGASTLVGQANAAGAIAVGAALYVNTPPYSVNPPTIASFSSVGGTIVEGTTRNKPEIVSPEGINTTVDFGSYDYEPDGFANFYGTSASAPHAAASAALIIEAQRKFLSHQMLPAEIKTLFETTALDMNLPGYDPVTGYGLLQPLTAMETFASPRPIIIGLADAPPLTLPVNTTLTVTVKGKFLNPQTVVYLRGVPITTHFLNTDSVTAEIAPFTDNPVIQLYNPPITSSLLDGGFSDSLYFYPKKHIIIKANNVTKKYGEALPSFSSTITIDGVPLAKTQLTATVLKLDPISYTTPATSSSNIADYFIHPYNTLDPHNHDDSVLLATYEYNFVDGLLTIKKLPVKIIPRDTSLVYGRQIHGIGFNYLVDPSANVQNADSLIGTIRQAHTSAILDSVFVLASGAGATSRALVNSDLDSLGILISNGSGATSRALVNNGPGEAFTSYVVDINNESVYNYEANPSSSPLVSGAGATSRALVNTGPLINGLASVIFNGAGAISRALVNGDPLLLNSTTTGKDSISNIAVIISSSDVPSSTVNRIFTTPANLVTGITTGEHLIAPAAFISGNFDISYGLGKLIITPAPLTVTANDYTSTDGTLPPSFAATVIGYQYQDSTTMTITGPLFTLLPNYTGAPGNYTIRPYGLSLSGDSNYTKTYLDGNLTVDSYGNKTKKILLKLKCIKELPNHDPSGYKYVAHFYYENKNSMPITIPVGPDNYIASSQPYGGVQPSTFLPGVNYVDFYFNGQKLTWTVRSNEGVSKKTVSEVCDKNSSKCGEHDRGLNDVDISFSNIIIEQLFETGKLYPNPANSTLWLKSDNYDNSKKAITIMSAVGVRFDATIKSREGSAIEIDVSTLPKGVYFIRITANGQLKTLSFIKL